MVFKLHYNYLNRNFSKQFSAMQCSGGSVYLPCGPTVQETCGTGLTSNNSLVIESCEEGCYCPPGTVLHSQSCITRDQCPCQLRRKYFQPGETVPRGCNTW